MDKQKFKDDVERVMALQQAQDRRVDGYLICQCDEPAIYLDHAVDITDQAEEFCLNCDKPIHIQTARKLAQPRENN